MSGVASVERAITILSAFTHDDLELSLAELSSRTGLYKSTILRIMESLEANRFVIKSQAGKYRIGPRLFQLGSIYAHNFDLNSFILPALETLVARCGEDAAFFVREGDKRLCLMRAESRKHVRADMPAGVLMPLHSGAAGHVLTDYEDAGAGFGTADIVLSRGERDPELGAVAAPVFGAGGALVGALCAHCTITRINDDEHRSLMERAVLQGARELTAALGGDLRRYKPA